MSEDLAKRALQLELKQRYVEAAELWQAAGQIDKAIYNFHRGSAGKRAIDLALKEGLKRKAAELYLKAEIYDKAGELYRQERDYSSAGRAYRQGGMVAQAATMFEHAEDWKEAARLFESINDFLRAGELYERAGDIESSARVYELAIDQKAIDRLGGKKNLRHAAEILTKVKRFEKAAEIYVQSQEVAEAILMFVRMGEIEGASRLLSNCQGDIGFEVLTHIDYRDKNALDFAKMFYLARDYEKAGRVFEACGEYAKAAYLFEKCQEYHRAGEVFTLAGELLKAATMFEKAGSFADAGDLFLRAKEPLRAAACYEAGQSFYKAGQLYFEAERFDKAMDLLQKLDASSSRYTDGSVLIAEILRQKGYLDLAVERYRAAIAGLTCDAASIDHHYKLAAILKEKSDYGEAERLLLEVVRVNFGYAEAASMLEDVRRLKAQPVARLPTPAAAAEPTVAPSATAAPEPAPQAEGSTGQVPVTSERSGIMVGRMEGFEVLAQTSLFQELSLAEMRRFWEICESRRFQAGQVIVAEHAVGGGLFVLREGTVSVLKDSEILVQLHPGEYFGEMSLVDADARTSATVEAAADVTCFFIGRDAFHQLLGSNDHAALKMYRGFVTTLCARLRHANEELAKQRRKAH